MNNSKIVPKRFIDNIISPACAFDEAIISAFTQVPRAIFLDDAMSNKAYEDVALPIGHHQTASQPSTIAHMLSLMDLSKSDKVLEIGFGSGYLTALLAKLAGEVYAIEYLSELFKRTRPILRSLRLNNIALKNGDGTEGWQEFAPFDKIVVSALAKNIPQALVDQLREGGLMIIPLRDKLVKCEKKDGELLTQEGRNANFVEFIGS